MPISLDTWQWLLTPAGEALIEKAGAVKETEVANISRLRKHHSAEQVQAAMSCAAARNKAHRKFPRQYKTLIADAQGLEQATSSCVGQYKASRFSDLATTPLEGRDSNKPLRIADLCSGIGGDAIAFSQAGMNVTGIDCDESRAWMTDHNANCKTQTMDIDNWLDTFNSHDFDAYHIDPQRRNTSGRIWQLQNCLPGPETLSRVIKHIPSGAIKLGPGVDRDDAAEQLPQGDLEFISENGQLVQAIWWTGVFASGTRRATCLYNSKQNEQPSHIRDSKPATLTLQGHPKYPPVDEPQQYVFTYDSSVERAELTATLCEQLEVKSLHPKSGLLTSNQLINSPWLTAFELIEQMPWREPRIKKWLQQHDAGIVEIKTRGKVVNPDHIQKQLRGTGPKPFTLFIQRFDQKVVALITRRIV